MAATVTPPKRVASDQIAGPTKIGLRPLGSRFALPNTASAKQTWIRAVTAHVATTNNITGSGGKNDASNFIVSHP